MLTLSKLVPDSLSAERKLLFMPTNLTEGMELSDDPLPTARTAAYAVSFARRSQAGPDNTNGQTGNAPAQPRTPSP